MVKISHNPIDPVEALNFVHDEKHGAVSLFLGSVRSPNRGRVVKGIEYEIHGPLCEKVLADLALEAQTKWGTGKVYIAHRHGLLQPGDISVAVAVSSPHRDEACKASRYILEELKRRAPIWKKEHYEDGESDWVKGHALCQHGKAKDESGGNTLGGGEVHSHGSR